jgi:hypothetical protein
MSNDIKKIAAKIAACLALATSDNANEAQTAQRQAEALMKKYNLTSADVMASQVSEKIIKSTNQYQLPVYLCNLASVIAKAFACGNLFNAGNQYRGSSIKFFGFSIKPELAAYTYEVLARQLKKDRKVYRDSLKRYKPANKTRMADIFAEAWVYKIYQQVHDFAGTEQEKAAIAAYRQQKHPAVKEDARQSAAIKKESDCSAVIAGINSAASVKLFKPVQTKRMGLLINQDIFSMEQ